MTAPAASFERGARAQLRAVARAYLREARRMTYRELRARQEAPWASIAFGAAGIATALCLGGRERAAGDVAHAGRWLDAAARGARARGAFGCPEIDPATLPTSVYYGASGLALVRAALGVDPARSSLVALLARSRRALGGPTELFHGSAGHLTGLMTLHARTRDARALAVADELARDLLARARGRRGWARAKSLGFAHGRAGAFFALLRWSIEGRRELPPAFFVDLADLADAVIRARSVVAERSWCNGAAGFVVLWARAHEHTPDAARLRLARRTARALSARTAGSPGNLCCGLGGRAYALLAMDRVDPGRGWYAGALSMAARAADAMLAQCGPWPNGLFRGYPGLVCLAADLSRAPRARIGFPLVEG